MLTINDYGEFEKDRDEYTVLGPGNGVFSETIAIGNIDELKERFLNGDFEFNSSINAIFHDAYGEFAEYPYDLQANREVAMAAVDYYGYDYEYLDDDFKLDREFAIAAIYSINEWTGLEDSAMGYIDESFRNDKELALALIDELSFKTAVVNIKDFTDEVKNDKEIAVKLLEKAATKENYMALYNSGINHEFFDEGIFDMNKLVGDIMTKVGKTMTTEEVIAFANKNGIYVDEDNLYDTTALDVVDFMRDHKEDYFNLEDYINEPKINDMIYDTYLNSNEYGEFLDFGNNEYGIVVYKDAVGVGLDEDNNEYYKVIVARGTVEELSDKFLNGEIPFSDGFNAILIEKYEVYAEYPEALRENKELTLENIALVNYNVEATPDALFNDKEIVAGLLTLTAEYGSTTEDVDILYNKIPKELLTDKDIFDSYLDTLQDAFSKDEGVIIANAFKQMGREDLLDNKEFVLPLVKLDGDVVHYISEELRADKQVMLEAVKEDGYALEYASKELQNDKEIVLAAVNSYGGSLCHASNGLKENKEVVLEAVKMNEVALKYASDKLRDDVDFVKEAVKISPNAIIYASDRIKNNPDLLKENSKSLFNKISQAQAKKDNSVNEKSSKIKNRDDLDK